MHTTSNACRRITVAIGVIPITCGSCVAASGSHTSHTSRYIFGSVCGSTCLIDTMLHDVNVEESTGLERIAG